MGTEIDHEVPLGEGSVATPKLGDADSARQIMVAAPLLTVAIRVGRGGVHPSGIGVRRPGLNGVCAWSARR